MTISDICIKRPVFTWVLVAIPVVLGLVSYGELGVDLFPDVDFPVCTVTTVLPGASVEEMETTVTKPIEDIINTVSGIDELRSTTTEGVSIITALPVIAVRPEALAVLHVPFALPVSIIKRLPVVIVVVLHGYHGLCRSKSSGARD